MILDHLTGKTNWPALLFKENNIETITWDLEPDTFYKSATDKIEYVNKNVKPGSIILLHSMYDESNENLQTIEGILDSLTKRAISS